MYGAISVKSNLESGDLESGYSNIGSLKKILLKGKVRHKNRFGSSWGANNPVPVTGIFAYNSKRSLEAIAEQVRDLDRNLGSIEMRPDFVAVVGNGIVGPRKPLRGDHNRYTLPQNLDDLVLLRRTPFSAVNVESDDKGRPTMKVPMFLPIPIEIDGQNYTVDTSSFGNEYFDEETGMTVEELLSD